MIVVSTVYGHYTGPDGLAEELGKGSSKNLSSQPQKRGWYLVKTSSHGSESIKKAEDLVLHTWQLSPYVCI